MSTVVRSRPHAFRRDDAIAIGGSALAAIATAWLLFGVVLPVQSPPAYVMGSIVAFLLIYRVVVRETVGRLEARDRLMAVVIGLAAVLVIAILASILFFVLIKGIRFLRISFFTETLRTVGPLDPPTSGGALHAIIGTLEQVAIAMVISVPLGVMTAVFLNELGGKLARPVRAFVNAMSGVPSIVAGLFIYAVLILGLGWGNSGLAASLALAILMLPTVTRTAEEVLRLVPGGLREAALALGAPEWRSVTHVVLPTAKVGIVTAVILGVARVIGETAPLIMTTRGSESVNANPLSGQQEALPLFIWKQVKVLGDPERTVPRGFAGALALMAMVLVLFVTARIVGRSSVDKKASKRSRKARGLKSGKHRRSA